MIDRTIEYMPVIMLNESLDGYPRTALPDGYSFDFWSPETGVSDWIRVQKAASALEGEGLEQLFSREFSDRADLLSRQMLFVRDESGAPVATATLWVGDPFGYDMARLHWVATDENHQGRGLMKALLTRIMDISRDMGFVSMYLVSQTYSYAAINVYQQYGFKRCVSPEPVNFKINDFENVMKAAWDIIDSKIAAYAK